MSGVPEPYRYAYVHVSGQETEYPLGNYGQLGDYLHRLVVTLTANNSADIYIHDGDMTHLVLPNGVVKGVYSIEMNMVSQDGGWAVSTSADAELLAVGVFTN